MVFLTALSPHENELDSNHPCPRQGTASARGFWADPLRNLRCQLFWCLCGSLEDSSVLRACLGSWCPGGWLWQPVDKQLTNS